MQKKVRFTADSLDDELTNKCQQRLHSIGLIVLANQVKARWNARMRTTAGRAFWPSCEIELNLKLKDYGILEVDRTLMHELAHLVAYQRCGRKRIDPHGIEWQLACAELGIKGERRTHTLPLLGNKLRRQFKYTCPQCESTVERVRPFARPAACISCCRKHNGGRFDLRFVYLHQRM